MRLVRDLYAARSQLLRSYCASVKIYRDVRRVSVLVVFSPVCATAVHGTCSTYPFFSFRACPRVKRRTHILPSLQRLPPARRPSAIESIVQTLRVVRTDRLKYLSLFLFFLSSVGVPIRLLVSLRLCSVILSLGKKVHLSGIYSCVRLQTPHLARQLLPTPWICRLDLSHPISAKPICAPSVSLSTAHRTEPIFVSSLCHSSHPAPANCASSWTLTIMLGTRTLEDEKKIIDELLSFTPDPIALSAAMFSDTEHLASHGSESIVSPLGTPPADFTPGASPVSDGWASSTTRADETLTLHSPCSSAPHPRTPDFGNQSESSDVADSVLLCLLPRSLQHIIDDSSTNKNNIDKKHKNGHNPKNTVVTATPARASAQAELRSTCEFEQSAVDCEAGKLCEELPFIGPGGYPRHVHGYSLATGAIETPKSTTDDCDLRDLLDFDAPMSCSASGSFHAVHRDATDITTHAQQMSDASRPFAQCKEIDALLADAMLCLPPTKFLAGSSSHTSTRLYPLTGGVASSMTGLSREGFAENGPEIEQSFVPIPSKMGGFSINECQAFGRETGLDAFESAEVTLECAREREAEASGNRGGALEEGKEVLATLKKKKRTVTARKGKNCAMGSEEGNFARTGRKAQTRKAAALSAPVIVMPASMLQPGGEQQQPLATSPSRTGAEAATASGEGVGLAPACTPSRFCHICTRSAKLGDVMVCGNVLKGTCRKVICLRCVRNVTWDWGSAKDDKDWICTHCRKVCAMPCIGECAPLREASRASWHPKRRMSIKLT